MRKKRTFTIALGTLLVAGAVIADDVWLKEYASMRADPSAASTTVAKVQKGDQVQQLEKQGTWVKIKKGNDTGWVAYASISIRQVKADGGALPFAPDARSSSAAAAKGLEPLALKYSETEHLSTAGLDQMTHIRDSITPRMLAEFMNDGKVGPQ